MAMTGKIRRMYFREKKSVREISRLTSLPRNTIDKRLKVPVEDEPKYRRSPRVCKLTPFHEQLRQALSTDAHRPKRDRRSARCIRWDRGHKAGRRISSGYCITRSWHARD